MVQAAARNNAQWCAAMCRSHGVDSQFGEQAWTAPRRTPRFYPDAVTLVPGAIASAVVSEIDLAAPDASVKDSFADVDLSSAGFHVLFDAKWLHRRTGRLVPGCELTCDVVTDPQTLRRWALAWDRGEGNDALFRPELLDDARTFVLAAADPSGRIAAGAVATRSDHVVGISNLFAVHGGADAAWPPVLQAVEELFPGLAVVTYDRGDALESALRHAFEPVGALRVWLRA